MNPEFPEWPEFQQRAASLIPANLSQRVIAQVQRVRRRRYEIKVVLGTLMVCLVCTGLTASWWSDRENEETLTQWQELAAATQVVEQGL